MLMRCFLITPGRKAIVTDTTKLLNVINHMVHLGQMFVYIFDEKDVDFVKRQKPEERGLFLPTSVSTCISEEEVTKKSRL